MSFMIKRLLCLSMSRFVMSSFVVATSGLLQFITVYVVCEGSLKLDRPFALPQPAVPLCTDHAGHSPPKGE